MGINRFSDIEERKRNETDAKAGDEVPKGKKGDVSSRVQASEGPRTKKSAGFWRSLRTGNRTPLSRSAHLLSHRASPTVDLP
jgi:hypothetical protein